MSEFVSIVRVLALAALAATVFAQESTPPTKQGRYWVQQSSGSLASGGRLRVSAVGSIVVRGANTNRVGYTLIKRVRARDADEAIRRLDEASLTAARQGTAAALSLAKPSCGRCGFQAELRIEVPHATSEVVIDGHGGVLDVAGIEGRVVADSAGGEITLDSIGGSVRATTAGGAIRLGSIGGAVLCETAGGAIQVKKTRGNAVLTSSGGSIVAGEIGGTLRAETAGGEIRAERVAGSLVAGTSGGSIEIGEALGSVNVETAGGGIRVASAPRGVRAETAAGDIRLINVGGRVFAASAIGDISAAFSGGTPLADSMLEANGGTIVVLIPAGLAVSIEAMVDLAKNLNRIESDFSSVQVSRAGGEFGGQIVARGDLNGGGAMLRIRNTSGRIRIRRQE